MRSHENLVSIKRKAYDIMINPITPDYISNWFGATGFFDTTYLTGVLKGRYFITVDDFLKNEIYAVRLITERQIETLPNAEGSNALDSIEEAQAVMNAHAKEMSK